jgi:hypothetical protein
MFTVVFVIKGGDFDGRKLWHYILPEQAEFRMREFTDALEVPPKGVIDTDKLVGTVLQIRTVVQKSEEYGEQARVKNVLPPAEGTSDAADGEEPPYEEWETTELAEEAEARELKITGRKTKQKLIAALEADDEAADDTGASGEAGAEEEEEDEEGDGEELTRADLAEMDRDGLRALIKEEGLKEQAGVKVLKTDSDDDLREKIATAMEIPEDEEESEEESDEEEEEEDDEAADYSTWDIADLKAELKERGLKPDGRKSILVKRLEQDDTSGSDPF